MTYLLHPEGDHAATGIFEFIRQVTLSWRGTYICLRREKSWNKFTTFTKFTLFILNLG